METKHKIVVDRIVNVLNATNKTSDEKITKVLKIINDAKPIDEKDPDVFFIRVEKRKRPRKLNEYFCPKASIMFRVLEYLWPDLETCKKDFPARKGDLFYKCERVI